jgi:hypothetical protein
MCSTMTGIQDGEICCFNGVQKNTQRSVEAIGTWLTSKYISMQDGVSYSRKII